MPKTAKPKNEPMLRPDANWENITHDDVYSVFDIAQYEGQREDDEGNLYDDYWVCVCDSHAKQYGKLGNLDPDVLDDNAKCDVKGCTCKASHFLDISVTIKQSA